MTLKCHRCGNKLKGGTFLCRQCYDSGEREITLGQYIKFANFGHPSDEQKKSKWEEATNYWLKKQKGMGEHKAKIQHIRKALKLIEGKKR